MKRSPWLSGGVALFAFMGLALAGLAAYWEYRLLDA